MKVKSESHSVVSDSLQPHGQYSPWNSSGQNTGVGSLSFLQEIFPTQGSNPGLLHCRRILYQLSHKESPRILAWVAYPFSSRSSQPRNQTRVSCIAGGFFTNWAIREASTSLILEKRKSKLQWGTTSHQSEWPSLKSLWTANAGEGVEKKEPSYIVAGNVSWCSHCGKQYGVSSENWK